MENIAYKFTTISKGYKKVYSYSLSKYGLLHNLVQTFKKYDQKIKTHGYLATFNNLKGKILP